MALRFSKDGKYFGQLSNTGSLKIWHTASNKFEQEFTPDVHLSSPCTCLHFIEPRVTTKSGSPRKKLKKRNSISEETYTIALGTTSGNILLYSIETADLKDTISSNTQHNISCLSWQQGTTLYAGADQYILQWNLAKRTVSKKWKTGNEKITAVLEIPDSSTVLTAAKAIKLWNVDSEELIRTFTGHTSEISLMEYVNPQGSNSYFLTGSINDRTLSCWSLSQTSDEKNALANFAMEDAVKYVNVIVTSEGVTYIATTVRNGATHIFQHALNGKCTKPLKPKTTIKIASNSSGGSQILPIPIIACLVRDETVTLAYGRNVSMIFEDIPLCTKEKQQCLIRADATQSKQVIEKFRTDLVVRPIVDDSTAYITPHTVKTSNKRTNEGGIEVAMEQRLETLALSGIARADSVPKMDNVAHLLVQGLHSKDKNILQTVLCQRDEKVIGNTVRRLQMPVIVPLLQELSVYIQGKTFMSQTGAIWIKHILQTHTAMLLSNPELSDLLSPILSSIQSRLSLHLPLNRLRGRLDLIVTQAAASRTKDGADDSQEDLDNALLVYNDKSSSDDELDAIEVSGGVSDSDVEDWREDGSDAVSMDDDDNNDDDDDDDGDVEITGVQQNGHEQDSDDDAMST